MSDLSPECDQKRTSTIRDKNLISADLNDVPASCDECTSSKWRVFTWIERPRQHYGSPFLYWDPISFGFSLIAQWMTTAILSALTETALAVIFKGRLTTIVDGCFDH
jgi:hypothetical protein